MFTSSNNHELGSRAPRQADNADRDPQSRGRRQPDERRPPGTAAIMFVTGSVAALTALMPMPASVLMRASLKLQRTTTIQNAWTALIDPSSGYTYYYDDRTGQSQWEVPAEFAQQGGGAQAGLKVVLWRLKGSPYRNSLNELVGVGSFTGVNGFAGEDKSRDYEIDTSSPVVYPLCEGDEQVLSRWNMLELTIALTLNPTPTPTLTRC